jgi:hypothetical protein
VLTNPVAAPLPPAVHAPPGTGRGDILARAAIVVAWLLLGCLTWGHWGEVARYDTGREMYVPYAMLQGKALYKDLWYTYGPLAPCWNALLFAVFGSRLEVLYASGLTQALAFALLLYAIARRFLPVAAASLAAGCFLLQAFQPDLFNFALPYAHAATLGALFSLCTLYGLVRHVLREPGPNLAAAGMAAGLALLTKQEFGAACYLILGFVLVLEARSQRSAGRLFGGLWRCLPGLLVNVAVYGWLAWRLTPAALFLDNLNTPWSYHMRAAGMPWLARNGFRFQPQEMLAAAFSGLISLALWFLVAALLERLLAWRGTLPVAGLSVIAFGTAAHLKDWPLAGALFLGVPLLFFPMGLPWLAAGLLAVSLLEWRRDHHPRHLAIAVLCLYALAIGLRVLFLTLPVYYGVYHSQALFLVFLILLTRLTGHMGRAFPAILVLEAAGLLAAVAPRPSSLPAPLHTARGTIYAGSSEAAVYKPLLAFLAEQQAHGRTFVVLPQEVSLYFFTGTLAPSRWFGLTPGTLAPEARQQDYIADLERYNADFIVVSNRDTKEYGLPYFGLDYDRAVYAWILQHYEPAGEFGRFVRDVPGAYGVRIYRRR